MLAHLLLSLGLLFVGFANAATPEKAYKWKNVKIGGGGGFSPGIVFNPSAKGVAYLRTDIGGAYRLNSDDSWTPLLDFAGSSNWGYWGVDAMATDPKDPKRLYLAVGGYTNSWDPNNGHILASTDYGATFTSAALPFKVGGNMPGRGMGERIAVDPHANNILFFGARSGNGLYKSTNYGASWSKVSGFTNVGTYVPDPSDTSGLNSDRIGIAWVTFDEKSGTSGSATPRIFVGVASIGSSNIFVSENGGSTWSAVAGQDTTYLPHKGVLSPSENLLYVSYSNGAGPYDGTLGAIKKYNIGTKVWTDITPVSGSDLYFGFGGVAVDLQNPGTVMVAALNSWYPEGQIYRSLDSGSTWSPLWTYGAYPAINKYFSIDTSKAPWLGPSTITQELGVLQAGWMMEALAIDPFDSNHFLYGTGATVYGGHNLEQWDSVHNITIRSLADGIEETAIQGLVSPGAGGPPLVSAVGDIGGFVHKDLNTAPASSHVNPSWATAADIDYAGNKPSNIVRIGTGDSSSGKQVALSTDFGVTWAPHNGAADNVNGGKVALSADGDTVLWRTSANGVQVSKNKATFAAVSSLPSGAVIASDKKDNTKFYGASGSSFYRSTNNGATFTVVGSLGSSTSPFDIAANPKTAGDVWVSADKGIFHSTDSGTTFTAISGVTQAWAIALGAPAKSGGYPAVYASANIGGEGVFRSDDKGATWVRINGNYGFGSAAANVMTADADVYGRVYIGTNGRGIFYGVPA